MNVQHINVKIFAREPVAIDLADAIPVFHGWIQDRVCEELLVDVADYRHVPAGPGVVLVAHEANYSLDYAGNRLGLLYNRKSILDGDTQQKLRYAFHRALLACRRLEQEAPFRGKLKFNAGDCDVILNDRLLAPNTEDTYLALKPEFDNLFTDLWGEAGYSLEWRRDPRERFRISARAKAPKEEVTTLLEASSSAVIF
jgi:hypothetical protein